AVFIVPDAVLDDVHRVGGDAVFVWLLDLLAVAAAVGGLGRWCREFLLKALWRPQRRGIEAERACPSDNAPARDLLFVGIVHGAGDAVRLADVAGVGVGIGGGAQPLAERLAGRWIECLFEKQPIVSVAG